MKNPRQTALTEVLEGSVMASLDLTECSCRILLLNSARYCELKVVCVVFKQRSELTGG